ncbi:MAG: M48 family metallopeptidase [Alphaproteobacteria bacterium]
MKTTGACILLSLGILVSACEQSPVTGRQQLVLISPEQATEMGTEAYRQILSESKISQDRSLRQRVEQVGSRIAAVVDRDNKYKWEFTVIDDATPNAFALPGGKVGVHTGLFKVTENDAQLAAVLGHEIAHVTVRHSAERISQQMVVQGGLVGIGAAAGGEYVNLAKTAATLGVVLPFSRKQESEADQVGLRYMAEAGYDPRAAVKLWQNFAKAGGDRAPTFLSTHPAPGNRIEQIQARLPEVMPIYKKNMRG